MSDELTEADSLEYPVLGSLLSNAAERYLAAAGTGPSQGLTQGGSPARPSDGGGTGNDAATTFALSITVDGDVQRIARLIEASGGTVHNVLDGYSSSATKGGWVPCTRPEQRPAAIFPEIPRPLGTGPAPSRTQCPLTSEEPANDSGSRSRKRFVECFLPRPTRRLTSSINTSTEGET